MGAPKSSKFSASGSGSSIVRGSTSTGSVSASSCWERVGAEEMSSSLPAAAETTTDEWRGERRRGEGDGDDKDDEDQVKEQPFRIAVGALFVADLAVSVATWLGPARACVLERIAGESRSEKRRKRER